MSMHYKDDVSEGDLLTWTQQITAEQTEREKVRHRLVREHKPHSETYHRFAEAFSSTDHNRTNEIGFSA